MRGRHPSRRNPHQGPECCGAQGEHRAGTGGEARPESAALWTPHPWLPGLSPMRVDDSAESGQAKPQPANRQTPDLPAHGTTWRRPPSEPSVPLTQDRIQAPPRGRDAGGLPPPRGPVDLAAEPCLPLWGPAEAGRSGRTSEGWARPDCPAPDPPPARCSSRGGGPGGNPVRTPGRPSLPRCPDGQWGRRRSPLPTPHPADAPGSEGATHRPGGGLGRAGLLEGDVEVVGAGVVGVGGDGRCRRHGIEGGAGLRVGRVGGHAGGVLRGVGAGRGRAAAHLVHGAAQQIELGLAWEGGGRGTHSQAGEWKREARGVLLQEP